MVYVMIDCENVKANLAIMAEWPKDGTVKIMIFLGQAQAKVREKAKQQLGSAAEFIQIEGQGKNALDFHIAFYIGQLGAKHAGAQFFVVSNDTGFDPLIKHLSCRKISCERVSSVAENQSVKPPTPARTAAETRAVIQNLVKRAKSLPKKLATLQSAIRDVLGKDVSGEKVDAGIKELMNRGVVKESKGKLTYKLPSRVPLA